MQDLSSKVLEMGKNRLLVYFLLSTMSIVASPFIIFIFKLSTIRKQCTALSVCNLVKNPTSISRWHYVLSQIFNQIAFIFLILATTAISQLPSQVLNAVSATASPNRISVVRGIWLLFVSCLTTIISCVTLYVFLALGCKDVWRDEDENWIWEHIHSYCFCGSRSQNERLSISTCRGWILVL